MRIAWVFSGKGTLIHLKHLNKRIAAFILIFRIKPLCSQETNCQYIFVQSIRMVRERCRFSNDHSQKYIESSLIPMPMRIQLSPSLALQRFLLQTRFVRIIGRRLISYYKSNLPNGDQIFIRPLGNDEEIIQEVFGKDLYGKYYKLKAGDRVVDVGANIGSFSLKACSEVGKDGRVLAIEPASENRKLLSKNISLNNYGSICTIKALGAGSSETFSQIKIYEKGGDNTILDRGLPPKRTEKIEIKILDWIVAEANFDRVDFLKIDVEGFELEVLKGSQRVLSEYHPKIALETHKFGPSPTDIKDHLAQWDYSCKLEHLGEIGSMMYAG
ncbi:MAG: FkbM family methyltransferase [Nitrososphaerales archaeon]